MKKHRLQELAKFAAVSLVGAFPLFGIGEIDAQQLPMPPIVQANKTVAAPNSNGPLPAYSYASGMDRPLAPAQVVTTPSLVPPIVSGKPVTQKGSLAESKKPVNNLLTPIGSGIKQVKANAGPARVARAFSPAKMPVRAQGSGTRNIPAPAIQISPPSVMTAPRMTGELIPSPLSSSPTAPVISGSLVGPGGSAPAMSPSPMVVSPNYFDAAPVTDSVSMGSVVSGCGDCGGSGCSTCDTGCSDCGGGGCSSCGDGQATNDYGTYGSVSAARRYAYVEYLYMTREDGDITNSNFNPLGEFDFSPAWRFTFGQRPDMTQGREFSYFGTAGIDARQVTNDASNRLDSLFTAAGGLIASDLSAFNDATQHIQYKETDIHSIELNRVRWGWDVLKSFVGWRYVYMADQYQLDSTAFNSDGFGGFLPTTETGRYRMDTINHLLGAHIGAELFYDIGYRFSLSGMSKYGVYANLNKVDNFLVNGGTVLLDTEDNGANISSTWEIHLLAHYQIRQTARLRFGYNGMFLGNVATVADNFSPFVSPFTGFSGSDDDDAFVHGFSIGLELYR